MATLRDYFDTDFKHVLTAHQAINLKPQQGDPLEVVARVHLDFDADAKYISYFIPSNETPFEVCSSLVDHPEWALSITDSVLVKGGFVGEQGTPSTELKFTGKMFLYTESPISDGQKQMLLERSSGLGLGLVIRGQDYVLNKAAIEKPLAFICHDSRDKDEVARPLALRLHQMMCPVWFDEFSLKVGMRLRESVEKGLKECRKCVLVLSPSFISNEGWTKSEFDAVFTREMIEREDIILPVWHNVSAREVYEYSPSLANRVALRWDSGVGEVARHLYKVIIK